VTEIVVALIAMVGTVAAALVPKWLEMRRVLNGPAAPKPVPLAAVLVIAAFTLVGVWASYDRASVFSSSAAQTSFFLGITGIASSLFGGCAVSRKQRFGTYVGYVSAVVAALFLMWSVLIGPPSDGLIQVYALATTITVGWALWLFWRSFILRGVADQRRLREERNKSES